MATYAKLGYNGKVQTIALFEGLDTEELNSLLKTVFSIEGNIVGFMAEVRTKSGLHAAPHYLTLQRFNYFYTLHRKGS